MRAIPYLLCLFFIAFFYTNLSDLLAIGPARIMLVAAAVLFVALYREYLISLWFACAAGFVYDVRDPSHLGAHMLILAILSIATSFAREHFNLASIRSQIILLTIGLILYAVPTTLIYGTSGVTEFWGLLWSWAFPSIIYTAALSAAVLVLFSGRWLKFPNQAGY